MANLINLGTANRKSLNYINKYTLRLKSVFPTYEIYHDALLENGAKEEMINEQDYKMIMSLGASVFVKWLTATETRVWFTFELVKHFEIYKKYETMYNLSVEEMLQNKQTNTQNIYSTNEDDVKTNRKYLTSSVENITEQTNNKLDNLILIQNWLNGLDNPKQKFIKDLINSVALPLQPKRRHLQGLEEDTIDEN